ncbi:MAG: transposase family protein [Lentilactobacillus diolivorans]|jgi:transposase|nr:transposase family protein [Lentilactobacillus diolivorans]RRG02076.1 MAG: transposase family protein [Lactobacillus sp.]
MNSTDLIDLPGIEIDQVKKMANQYDFYGHATAQKAVCPACHHASTTINARHLRKIQGLPIANRTVWLILKTCQFACLNPRCDCHFFMAPLSFMTAQAQRTNRLNALILRTVAQRSSTATAALLQSTGIQVHKSAICNLFKKKRHD